MVISANDYIYWRYIHLKGEKQLKVFQHRAVSFLTFALTEIYIKENTLIHTTGGIVLFGKNRT